MPPVGGSSRAEFRERPGAKVGVGPGDSWRVRHTAGLLGRRAGEAVGVRRGERKLVTFVGTEGSGPEAFGSPAGKSKYDSI
jgi:hypothetical protein